jgi:uroporphyrinogen decarboxylase
VVVPKHRPDIDVGLGGEPGHNHEDEDGAPPGGRQEGDDMTGERKTQYSPRERVVAAYKGQFADRVPAYPIAGVFAGCLDGLSIEEYCTDPTKASRAMLNYYERFQPDIMIAFNDLAKEAEAVGCHVKYSDYVVPSIDQHVLQDDKGKLARLEIPDPKKDGRLPAFLEQCTALSKAGLPSALGSVNVGPWTIAMLMRNPELMCLDTIDDPEFVHELMRFTTEYAKRVGDAVLETRIGLSYSDPTASCSLVGPDTYREFIKPYHKELVDYFKAKKVGTTVHICGTTHQIHEDLMDVGFVAITIDLDQQADPALKVDQLDRLVTLGNQRGVVAIGNVDVTIFERATRAEIEAEVRRCIDTVGHRSRFVLSTSCELPPRADPECVRWFMEAAREYGRYDRMP